MTQLRTAAKQFFFVQSEYLVACAVTVKNEVRRAVQRTKGQELEKLNTHLPTLLQYRERLSPRLVAPLLTL